MGNTQFAPKESEYNTVDFAGPQFCNNWLANQSVTQPFSYNVHCKNVV